MMTDPVADLLTRIRNAVAIEKTWVEVPYSNLKKGVCDALKREGFIWNWKVVEASPCNRIAVELKYGPNGERVIRRISRTSKPGRRVYQPAKELRPVLEGLGISILSTSRGIVSDREARRQNVGGEVLCTLW